ncbi:hypothetical protein J2W37_002844 [Variovorax paradoxus]|uniref:hypothetical protein n=1 Tax=Variovorax paradoxus TaxID=34073 RepID=UPI002783900C|nr:hypothetical protein [Variovorax paradoxus]MDP9965124.1 hypothetical protein [Variovorax paradoxus]
MLKVGRVIPRNPSRQIEAAAADAEHHMRISQPSAPHPLAGAIYTGERDPKDCSTCNRRGHRMREVARGEIECSHVECPHRKSFTARPSASGVRFED